MEDFLQTALPVLQHLLPDGLKAPLPCPRRKAGWGLGKAGVGRRSPGGGLQPCSPLPPPARGPPLQPLSSCGLSSSHEDPALELELQRVSVLNPTHYRRPSWGAEQDTEGRPRPTSVFHVPHPGVTSTRPPGPRKWTELWASCRNPGPHELSTEPPSRRAWLLDQAPGRRCVQTPHQDRSSWQG